MTTSDGMTVGEFADVTSRIALVLRARHLPVPTWRSPCTAPGVSRRVVRYAGRSSGPTVEVNRRMPDGTPRSRVDVLHDMVEGVLAVNRQADNDELRAVLAASLDTRRKP